MKQAKLNYRGTIGSALSKNGSIIKRNFHQYSVGRYQGFRENSNWLFKSSQHVPHIQKNTKRHFNPVLIVYYFVLNAHIFNKTIQTNFLFVRSFFIITKPFSTPKQNRKESYDYQKRVRCIGKTRIIPCLETLKIVTLKPTVRNSNSLT